MTVKVGLTGGIGSGKSAVGRLLAEHGALVIDYDQVARDIVEPGEPALASIVERFGTGVLAADGRLDRAALGDLVFANEADRRDLESITHTAIFTRAAELEAAAVDGQVVVHEIPLLVETGMAPFFDVVVVVDADVQVRVERLTTLRGMDEADARARIAAQLTSAERNAAADVVIDNSGDAAALAAAVDDLWTKLA